MRSGRQDAGRAALAMVALAAFVAALAWAGRAGAQALTLPTVPGISEPLGDVRSDLPERRYMAPGSVAIFDYDHTFSGTELEGAPMWWRKGGTNDTGAGWELSFGAATESRVGQLFVAGLVRTQFRWFDSKSVALTPLQNMAMVGIKLGPFEPESRVGFSLLTFDVFHGAYSFEMFSPRIEAGLGIRIGRFRVAAHGYSEMIWRWWGSNYWDKGIAFSIRLDAAKKKNPLAE
jgi:hypothetical protein